jgi:penicillin-binding protein 2
MPASEPKLRRAFRRLGRVLGLAPRTIQRRVIEGIAEAPYSNVTVKVDVPRSSFNFLKERKDEFPGVDVEKLFLRAYPHKELGAQLFGTLREISPKELKKKKYRGVAAGTRIGAGGIEQSTTATCAARTASRGWSSTRSATATTRARSPAASRSRASGCG